MAVSINGCCFCPLSVISAPRPSFPFSYSSFPLLLFVIPASSIRHSRAGGNPGRLSGRQDLLFVIPTSPIRHSRFFYSSFPLLLLVIPAQAGIQAASVGAKTSWNVIPASSIRHSRAGGNPVKPNLYINPSNVDSYLQSTSASMPASIS